MRSPQARLPLRWKLTVAFSAASAVVLAAVGTFLYVRFASVLDLALEQDLRARSAQIGVQVERSDIADLVQAANVPVERDQSFAQILRLDGSVGAATAYPDVRLLSAEQLTAARDSELVLDRPGDEAVDESFRLLVTPVHGRHQDFIVIVGASLDEHKDALGSLWQLEVVALGAALVARLRSLLRLGAGAAAGGAAPPPRRRYHHRAARLGGRRPASGTRGG